MSSTEAVQDDGPPPSVLICLLRLDLRIEDNALWHFAHTGHAPPSTARPTSHNASKLPREEELFSRSTHLLPLYVFDEREVELSGLPGYVRKGPEARTQNFNFWKTGAFRARFIAESVYDLRSRLRDRGSDLCIRFGRVEDVVANLVKAFQDQSTNVEGVWMQKEMTSGEVGVEERIEERLRPINVPVKYVHCKTLIHPADLPFEIEETPDVFTPFRKRVEALGPAMVRPLYHAPAAFKAFPRTIPQTEDYSLDVTYEVDVDGLATADPESKPKDPKQTSFYDILRYLVLPLNEVHFPPTVEGSSILQQRHHASAFPLRGGESSALERLDWYFVRGKSPDSTTWGKSDPPPVARYKQTRNNLIGHSYSTKMSPFLAYGSISPRQIWQALMHHESSFGEDQNIYWVKFELLWRDYFFFVAEKFGDLLFHLGGFELATDPPQAQKKLVPGWWKTWDPIKEEPPQELTRMLEGRTGIPFIDANIRELRESGFLSNRGRQNIASYVAHDLGYDWRIGAEFFQSYLIDYDPTSNYGNWAYVAGVGNDPRASRRFNIIKQAKDYDSHGEYVKTWLPVLRGLPTYYVHTPWLLDAEERRRYGVKASEQIVTMDSYPGRPMTEDEGWKKHYERKEGAGSRMHGNPQEKVKDGKVKRFRKPRSAVAGVGAEIESSSAEGNHSDSSLPAVTHRLPTASVAATQRGSLDSLPSMRSGHGNGAGSYRTGPPPPVGLSSSERGGAGATTRGPPFRTGSPFSSRGAGFNDTPIARGGARSPLPQPRKGSLTGYPVYQADGLSPQTNNGTSPSAAQPLRSTLSAQPAHLASQQSQAPHSVPTAPQTKSKAETATSWRRQD